MGILLLLEATLYRFIRRFTRGMALYHPLFLTLCLFSAGFLLRLSGTQGLVDIGFYLTESSALFATVLFTAALVLGQQRYWKV